MIGQYTKDELWGALKMCALALAHARSALRVSGHGPDDCDVEMAIQNAIVEDALNEAAKVQDRPASSEGNREG